MPLLFAAAVAAPGISRNPPAVAFGFPRRHGCWRCHIYLPRGSRRGQAAFGGKEMRRTMRLWLTAAAVLPRYKFSGVATAAADGE